MFGENFTGDRKIYLKIYNYLVKEGFEFSKNTKPVHIGDNKYEFEEDFWKNSKLGCHDVFKIQAWVENGEVKYKKHKAGSVCID